MYGITNYNNDLFLSWHMLFKNVEMLFVVPKLTPDLQGVIVLFHICLGLVSSWPFQPHYKNNKSIIMKLSLK